MTDDADNSVTGDEPTQGVSGTGPAWNNGLLAASYVPLTDVSKPMAPRLLSALQVDDLLTTFG